MLRTGRQRNIICFSQHQNCSWDSWHKAFIWFNSLQWKVCSSHRMKNIFFSTFQKSFWMMHLFLPFPASLCRLTMGFAWVLLCCLGRTFLFILYKMLFSLSLKQVLNIKNLKYFKVKCQLYVIELFKRWWSVISF